MRIVYIALASAILWNALTGIAEAGPAIDRDGLKVCKNGPTFYNLDLGVTSDCETNRTRRAGVTFDQLRGLCGSGIVRAEVKFGRAEFACLATPNNEEN